MTGTVTLLIILAVVIIIIAVVLVIIGLRSPEDMREQAIFDRLEEFSHAEEEFDLEKIEMSQPFSERVIYPLARSLGNFVLRFTPQNALESLAVKIEQAGNPPGIDPSMFLFLQIFAALGLASLFFFLFTFGPTRWPMVRTLLVSLLFAMLGFYLPNVWLSGRISSRKRNVQREMPDTLDLLTICVEAGLGFDAAMAKVSEKWDTELSMGFRRVIREIQLGKLRRDALRDMADRMGVSELTSFVAAVIQSEQLGVSLAKVLRVQSDQMRVKRRQRAEEEAQKAPLKMLIPLGLLIFPALMIVLLTPAGLRLVQSFLGGGIF